MKRFLLALLLCCSAVPFSAFLSEHSVQAFELQNRTHVKPEQASRIPEEAVEVYENVLRTGRAPDGYVGGRVWENREHRLPRNGDYREYDIHPKVRGRNRGAERIIIDLSTKKGWYTGDHYRTFVLINRRIND